MPALVRRLLIFAAIDGLVLQPQSSRTHPSSAQPIKIPYNGRSISPLPRSDIDQEADINAIESHGIVGLLRISSQSFLISISGREQVAQIRGKPIFTITDVAVIPLSSREQADKAITQAQRSSTKQLKANDGNEEEEPAFSDYESHGSVSDDDDTSSINEAAIQETESKGQPTTKSRHERTSSIAQDVMGKKGQYGRFADKWFSRRGWSAAGRRNQGMSTEETEAPGNPSIAVTEAEAKAQSQAEITSEHEADPSKEDARAKIEQTLSQPPEAVTIAMLPKILRTTKIFFGSRSFFFSYDYDLSRRLVMQSQAMSSNLPLFKLYDPLFFWNHHIMAPFMESNQSSYVLPVIQGFVGQRAFKVEATDAAQQSAIVDATQKAADVIAIQSDDSMGEEDRAESRKDPKLKEFLLTLISRRSTKRAGLRYLRRGVDDEGNVANSVETEQLLSSTSWDSAGDKIYSFVQIRGSIPLFFSQSPYSFKPNPVLWGSPETNEMAFRKHFTSLAARYGYIQVASLVDKHGTEASIGEAFEQHAITLNEKGGLDGKGRKIGFTWFDFHAVCRGMKFENVSSLIDSLCPTLSLYGWTVQHNEALLRNQTGILRTNCMDCLDRTNVVQSACARHVLEQQLADQGIKINLQTDPTTSWFNTLWADNGDAVSKQYSGTAALKGDYTRTRRRNISGALTDFGLTLSRYYNNIVNDYFAQAVIDYLLGRASVSIFEEFEADMKAQDYALDLRKVRQNAIDTCTKIVVEDPSEDVVAGWTLSCPHEPNTIRTLPFEECVLLLTDQALYFCRFDWGTEKVREFERIELRHVIGLVRGVYITSTLAQSHTDEKKNVGLIIRYVRENEEAVRVNTRTTSSEKKEEEQKKKKDGTAQQEMRILAFKALPPRSSFSTEEGEASSAMTESQMVVHICDEIRRVVSRNRLANEPSVDAGAESKDDAGNTKPDIPIAEKEIISLADAKKSTGYFEQLGYSLKRLVWA